MDVHGTMIGAGQQGNARTHELMVEAGIVSGVPFLRAVLPPFRAARNMRAAMSGTQLASLVALVLLLKPCVVAATGDVEAMMTALQDMEAAGYSPKARLLERCVARCAVQRAALCYAVLPVKRNGWWLHAHDPARLAWLQGRASGRPRRAAASPEAAVCSGLPHRGRGCQGGPPRCAVLCMLCCAAPCCVHTMRSCAVPCGAMVCRHVFPLPSWPLTAGHSDCSCPPLVHHPMQARRWEVEGGMQALTGTSAFLR